MEEKFKAEDIQNTTNSLEKTIIEKIEEISKSSQKIDQAIMDVKQLSNTSLKIDQAIVDAEQAILHANAAKDKKAGWSLFGKDKKEAIEALQQTGLEQAKVISDLAENQMMLFNSLNVLSKATKDLFCLGVVNMATTRLVYDTISSGLQKRDLNQHAREALLGVAKQLKAQLDIFDTVERCSNKCKDLTASLNEVENRLEECDKNAIRLENEVAILSDKNKKLYWVVYIVCLIAIVNFIISIIISI